MIERFYLSEWRQSVPWIADYQVEQDLIISRALINLHERKNIRENLIFRGGTSLNKLFFKPPLRYSEDIDLVQIKSQPIGPLIADIRVALAWLGQPKGKLTNRSAKLLYQYTSVDNVRRKLKIEINTTEHFNVYELSDHEFILNSSWFSGSSLIRTYQLNELIGTKLRALYQRNKGRDLFDIWYVLKMNLVDCQAVVDVFNKYCGYQKLSVTRAMFEKNLFEKKQSNDFASDVINLITDPSSWLKEEAFQMIDEKLAPLLSGNQWKSKR